MAKRNVVDFRIINLSEEKFQELKEAGQIDPNALYTTPDTTKERLDALEENKQDKGDYATNTALSQGLAQKQDIATAVNYDNITNCITEIPQDIKLEIVDGAVVLKAGSKVYVPNGAGVFNVVTIANDIARTTNIGGIVFVNSTGTSIYTENLGSVYSGDSAPSSGGLWYDTANNLVKYSTNGQSWSGQYSFPIGIVSTGGGQITSIDQVFNGLGYIGSTVFALPGVKGLTPDGRNEEGTLKNVSWTTSSIILRTYSSAYSGEYDIFFNGASFGALKKTYVYDEESNYNMDSNNRYNSTYIGRAYITSGTISYFATKNAFHAVDYSDFESTVEEINSSISAVDSSAVHKTGNETIADIKTFEASPIVPTPEPVDNSTKATTTAWVRTHTSNVVRLVEEQKPTSENNYTWYRKYDNGWVEQGGWVEGGENIASNVVFPVPMPNIQYALSFGGTQSTNATSGDSSSYRGIFRDTGTVSARSTTGFTLGNGVKISWNVCGYAAQ